MKIGIVTVNKASNYGAVLQAYATARFLSRYGSVEFIDYDNKHVRSNLRLVRTGLTVRDFFRMGKDVLRFFPKKKALSKFNSFFSLHMKNSESLTKQELYSEAAPVFDVYVAGSDQIWNPNCISASGLIDPVYFLDFAPEGSRKVSYASSLGSYKPGAADGKLIANYLSQFSAISLREKDGAEIISSIVEKDVEVVLDPCFLLGASEWDSIVSPDLHESAHAEKYIAVYLLKVRDKEKKLIKRLVDETGYKVRFLSLDVATGLKADEYIKSAGPADFVSFIKNSAIVVTNSFHGTVFSLIYGLPFLVSSPGAGNNRIENILEICNASNRLVRDIRDVDTFDVDLIRTGINREGEERLNAMRDRSATYLESAVIT